MSLVAWYKLDGNANDSSGNDRHLSTISATATANGKIGSAYSFAAGNYIMSSSGMDFTSTISVAAWGYSTSFAASCMLFSLNSASMSGPDLYFTSGTICWNIGNGASSPFKLDGVNVSQPTINEWHHYVVVNDAKAGKAFLYIDGVYSGETTYRDTTQVNRGFTIGNYYPGSTGYAWAGTIDDVRIYDHALSEKEIKELSKAKVLHYTFDDFQEPTENLYNVSHTGRTLAIVDASGFITYGTSTTIDGEYAERIIKAAGTPSAYASYRKCITVESGQKYTLSFWIKLLSGDISSVGLHFLGGSSSLSPKMQLGDLYYFEYTGIPNLTGLCVGIGFVGTAAMECYVFKPQIEKKDHATPFVAGSRSGIVRDVSGYDNDASLVLATTPKWVEDAKIGSGAYEFDGSKYITTEFGDELFADTSKQWTVSVWFKWVEAPTVWGSENYAHVILGSSGGIGTSATFNIYNAINTYNGSQLYYCCVSIRGINTAISSSTVNDGLWHHAVVTWDGVTAKSYFDGTNETILGKGTAAAQGYPTWIGVTNIVEGSYVWFLEGAVDDVRIYNTALSADDVLELYQTRASLDSSGNLLTHEIDEPDEILLIGEYTRNVYDQTYRALANIVPDTTDLSRFVEDDSTLGNIAFEGWVYCSSVDYYPTTFELTKENNTKGVMSVFSTVDGTWKVGWNKCLFYPNSWPDAANAPWYDMDRLELYRSGDPTGVDTTQYITFKDIKIKKFPSNIETKPQLSSSGKFSSIEHSEVGITDGLVGWWPLDGHARDLTENRNDGTVYGAVVASGIDGLCYSFDDVDDYIEFGNVPVYQSMTLSLWVKPNTTNNGQCFFGKNSLGGGNILLFGYWSGGYNVDISAAGQIAVGDTRSGVWDHLVLTAQGGASSTFFTLYRNGINIGTLTLSGLISLAEGTTHLGMEYDGASKSDFYGGLISDVRVYNRILTISEIQTLYDLKATTNKMKITEHGIYISGEFDETL